MVLEEQKKIYLQGKANCIFHDIYINSILMLCLQTEEESHCWICNYIPAKTVSNAARLLAWEIVAVKAKDGKIYYCKYSTEKC